MRFVHSLHFALISIHFILRFFLPHFSFFFGAGSFPPNEKERKKAPPCRCTANKTPSYATRWVASRAFTLPSSILRWEVCNPAKRSSGSRVKSVGSYHTVLTYTAGCANEYSVDRLCGERRNYSSSSSSRNSYSSLSLSRKISATRSSSSSSRMASR